MNRNQSIEDLGNTIFQAFKNEINRKPLHYNCYSVFYLFPDKIGEDVIIRLISIHETLEKEKSVIKKHSKNIELLKVKNGCMHCLNEAFIFIENQMKTLRKKTDNIDVIVNTNDLNTEQYEIYKQKAFTEALTHL